MQGAGPAVGDDPGGAGKASLVCLIRALRAQGTQKGTQVGSGEHEPGCCLFVCLLAGSLGSLADICQPGLPRSTAGYTVRRLRKAGPRGCAEPKSEEQRELADRGESAHAGSCPEAEHGDRLGPARGPEPNWSLASPAARALPAPDPAQAGRRHRVPEHLQLGQALPRLQGIGHRLEGPGEPGRAGRKGRFLPQLSDVRKPGAHWPAAG